MGKDSPPSSLRLGAELISQLQERDPCLTASCWPDAAFSSLGPPVSCHPLGTQFMWHQFASRWVGEFSLQSSDGLTYEAQSWEWYSPHEVMWSRQHKLSLLPYSFEKKEATGSTHPQRERYLQASPTLKEVILKGADSLGHLRSGLPPTCKVLCTPSLLQATCVHVHQL